MSKARKRKNISSKLREHAEQFLLEFEELTDNNECICRGIANEEWEVNSTWHRERIKYGEEHRVQERLVINNNGREIYLPTGRITLRSLAQRHQGYYIPADFVFDGYDSDGYMINIRYDVDIRRHYGFETEEIDFTTNPYIALYFACKGSPYKNGKVILLPRNPISGIYEIKESEKILLRSQRQESIYVVPSEDGILPSETYQEVKIPKHLKSILLKILNERYQFTDQRLFPDENLVQDDESLRFSNWKDSIRLIQKGSLSLDRPIEWKSNLSEIYPDDLGIIDFYGVRTIGDKAVKNHEVTWNLVAIKNHSDEVIIGKCKANEKQMEFLDASIEFDINKGDTLSYAIRVESELQNRVFKTNIGWTSEEYQM